MAGKRSLPSLKACFQGRAQGRQYYTAAATLEELDEPRNYFAIMKSVAKGNTSLASILNDTGLERGMVAKYLSVLSDLHVVERRVPITEKERSRRGLYVLADPYFRFWFRFVFENMAYLEAAGPARTARERVMPFFNSFVGGIFEDVALEWLRKNSSLKSYVFGRWWENAEEIDILGLDEGAKKLLLAEVKWSDVSLKDAKAILGSLAKKASLVNWHNEGRSTALCLIAKKIGGNETLRKEGFMAYDLQDLEK